jgi:hypothetical protein
MARGHINAGMQPFVLNGAPFVPSVKTRPQAFDAGVDTSATPMVLA